VSEFISFTQAAALIPDGATVMFGGFMGCGNAHHVIAELARLGTKNLTMICNDGALFNGPDGSKYYGVAKLIHNHQISKMYATHVGLNPEVAEQMNDGSLDVVLIPQGSFVEMIRAAGGGLGGILTRTGVGTIVEDSEFVDSKVRIDGQTYLLEKPLHADFSVISGYRIDKAGNIWYKGTTRNFAPYMAMAADVVIAEAENVVEVGAIEPENVVTSGILVDYVATAQAVEQ
jgi:acetate CoA/acetoacetate CoA-transferase alpha subunit